jgi:glucose uptake protein
LWLIPAQTIPFKNQQIKTFYVAAANLVLALMVAVLQGPVQLSFDVFWPPFLGGIIWAVSALCAFTATSKIGVAKAFGIWAPLNVIVSMIWGAVFFHEFLTSSPFTQLLLVASVMVVVTGIMLIIFAKGAGERTRDRKTWRVGLLGALGAGVLWGTYFVPIKASSVSLWIAAWPMAVGIFVGSGALVVFTRQSIRLAQRTEYARVLISGLLWSVGNYGSLLLIDQLGAGKGFTIAQVSIVVAALIAIYWLKDPRPQTRAATLTFIGCVLVTFGGIVLGNLK